MRHRKSGRQLNRSSDHRRALFRNMARSFITYERIRTTEAKAKELRGVIDRLITLALRGDLHSRRLAYKVLANHLLVKKLFDEIAPRYAGGKGGYTRIVKFGLPRVGDAAPMVIIELTYPAQGAAAKEAPSSEEKTDAVKAPVEPEATGQSAE